MKMATIKAPDNITIEVNKNTVSYKTVSISVKQKSLANTETDQVFRIETASEYDCDKYIRGWHGPLNKKIQKLQQEGKMVKITSPDGRINVYPLSLIKSLCSNVLKNF